MWHSNLAQHHLLQHFNSTPNAKTVYQYTSDHEAPAAQICLEAV